MVMVMLSKKLVELQEEFERILVVDIYVCGPWKSSMTDSLVATNGVLSSRLMGKPPYMDNMKYSDIVLFRDALFKKNRFTLDFYPKGGGARPPILKFWGNIFKHLLFKKNRIWLPDVQN